MELSKHKVEFLLSYGFEQVYKGEPIKSMGVMVNMERWDKFTEHNHYILYIHFVENEKNWCELYSGNSDRSEKFSERNLVSQIKKRVLEK